MDLMYYSLWFIIGFLVGGSVVYFLAFKLSSKVKLQDELTRSKRELANAKRALDEYFSNSSDLFAQLDHCYQQYAKYMSHSANRLSELGQELFEINETIGFARQTSSGGDSAPEQPEALPQLEHDQDSSAEARPQSKNNQVQDQDEEEPNISVAGGGKTLAPHHPESQVDSRSSQTKKAPSADSSSQGSESVYERQHADPKEQLPQNASPELKI